MSKETKNMIVPKLRFPEFRNGDNWIIEPLGEIYSFKTTNSFTREDLNYECGEIKNVHYGDIHTKFSTLFDISKEEVPFINPTISVENINEENYCREGDMIFADASEDLNDVGKSIEIINLNNERLLSGMHTLLARQKESKLVVGFGGYLFKSNSIRTQIQKEAQGAKVLGISGTRISNIKIYYPEDKGEQQKIAYCLFSLDELITSQTQKLEALKAHKKGLMRQLFPAEGEMVPKRRFKEFEESGEWEERRLGDISDVRDGTHDSPKFVNEGKPLLTSKNLLPTGRLDFQNVSLISEDDYEQINKRSKVNFGDILFGMIGTIGNPVLVKSEGFAIKNVALIKEKEELLNIYLIHFLNSDYINSKFNLLMKGNAQKFIALGVIRNITIHTPCLPEQQKIAGCLSSLDELIMAQTEKIEELKRHKKGLMQGLFPIIN